MGQPLIESVFSAIRLALGIYLFYSIGFIYTVIVLQLLNFVISKLAWHVFKMELLTAMDFLWILEDKNNPTNITVALTLEKCDADEFIKKMYNTSDQFFRFRSKITNYFGYYFYKKMTDEEYKEKLPLFCMKVDNVHNPQQVADLMAKEVGLRDPMDSVQFKTIFIQDYSSTESVFIFKCHHCLADGLALITLIMYFSDKFDFEQLPLMKKFPLYKKILIGIVVTFYAPFFFLRTCFYPSQKNLFHSGKPLTGIKQGAFTKDIPIELVKKVAKSLNATINDLLMGIASQSLKQYLVKNGDAKTKNIRINTQFSLRETPKVVDDQLINNNIGSLSIPFELDNDLNKAVKSVKRTMDSIKNSLQPFALYRNARFQSVALPTFISKMLSWFIVDKNSLAISNVPGPRTPIYFLGKQCKRMNFFVPGIANLSAGISILSYHDKINVGCLADKACISDPKSLIEIFENNFDRVISQCDKKDQ